MARGKYKRKRLRKTRRQVQLCETNLSVRVVHLLEKEGIKTLADLDKWTDKKLAEVRGIGEAAIQEIREYRLEL